MDSNAHRISVVMCTFQGERYLAEQLRSILSQSVPVQELVVADDGSTDRSLAIVRGLVADYRSVPSHPDLDYVELGRDPLVRSAPFGVAGNFERALEAATGDVIALSDQDDRWHPERLQRMLSVLDASAAVGLVHGDATLVDAEGQPLGVTLFEALAVTPGEYAEIDAGDGFDGLLRRNLVTGATAVIRASVRDAALPIPPGWIHDEWLAVVAAATGATAVVREPLVDYRQHGGNQIGASKLTWAARRARLTEHRGERNRRILERARSLVERLPTLDPPVDPHRVDEARAKLAHEELRSRLPEPRLRRVVPVLGEWRRGGYRRYGLGVQDVVRDLVQPG